MSLIGRRIIQSRSYIDPHAKEPNLNYEESFPITVFDAVRLAMDDPNSLTLMQALEQIHTELRSKQPIFPSMPANYLMTYAGAVGEVGSIKISTDIPWDPSKQTHESIPTEKAVGSLMFKLGLIDENGKPLNDPDSKHVNWSDVIGRPLAYETLGFHEDGFITQKGTTEAINVFHQSITDLKGNLLTAIDTLNDVIQEHVNNTSNPHQITPASIKAVTMEQFLVHIDDRKNPHKVTKEDVGLSNVDNTADIDKPVSDPTKQYVTEIVDAVIKSISGLTDTVNGLEYVNNITYDKPSGRLVVEFITGKQETYLIPVDGLVDEIRYDTSAKTLMIYELNGTIKNINLSGLIAKINMIDSNTIKFTTTVISDTEKNVKAEIRDKSITREMLADNIITTDNFTKQSVTTDIIADRAVTNQKIAKKAISTDLIQDRAVDGRTLFSSYSNNTVLGVYEAGTDPLWTRVTTEMIGDSAVTNSKLATNSVDASKIKDGSVTQYKIAEKAVTSEKLAGNLKFSGTPTIEIRPALGVSNSSIPDTFWVRNAIQSYLNTSDNIADRAIIASKIFTSNTDNRVLAVLRAGTDPVWTLITNGMLDLEVIASYNIQKYAVTGDKIPNYAILSRHLGYYVVKNEHIADDSIDSRTLFHAPDIDYVLGSVDRDGTPKYTKVTRGMMSKGSVTNDILLDQSIDVEKLIPGTEANTILTTLASNQTPVWTKLTGAMLGERSISPSNIVSAPERYMILGVTSSQDDPDWTKIYGLMIADKEIETRHIADRAINFNHIKEGAISYDHLDQPLKDRLDPNKLIQDGSVSLSKFEQSHYPYRVLGVKDQLTTPEWFSISTPFIDDGAVTTRKIESSDGNHVVLGSTQKGSPPEYLKITNDFIVDDTITPEKLQANFTLFGMPELTTHPPVDANDFKLASTAWVDYHLRYLLTQDEEFATTLFADLYAHATRGISDRRLNRIMARAVKATKPKYNYSSEYYAAKAAQ